MIFVDIYYKVFVKIIFILCIDEEGEYSRGMNCAHKCSCHIWTKDKECMHRIFWTDG